VQTHSLEVVSRFSGRLFEGGLGIGPFNGGNFGQCVHRNSRHFSLLAEAILCPCGNDVSRSRLDVNGISVVRADPLLVVSSNDMNTVEAVFVPEKVQDDIGICMTLTHSFNCVQYLLVSEKCNRLISSKFHGADHGIVPVSEVPMSNCIESFGLMHVVTANVVVDSSLPESVWENLVQLRGHMS